MIREFHVGEVCSHLYIHLYHIFLLSNRFAQTPTGMFLVTGGLPRQEMMEEEKKKGKTKVGERGGGGGPGKRGVWSSLRCQQGVLSGG